MTFLARYFRTPRKREVAVHFYITWSDAAIEFAAMEKGHGSIIELLESCHSNSLSLVLRDFSSWDLTSDNSSEASKTIQRFGSAAAVSK